MKLEIYMKSGNVIRVRGVKDYAIKMSGSDLRSLELKYFWRRPSRRLVMPTLQLDQIEAIVRSGLF
jgi:hypothetical protein